MDAEASTQDAPVSSVTIVGGGTAGWMTAAALSKLLTRVKVRLIESDEIGAIGVGEATIPHIRNYMALAGVDQLRMLHASKATFKLGIQFVDWGAPEDSYIHGFGRIGRDMLWLHTHQLWLAARERGVKVSHFDQYSINCRAALDNRFRFQDPRLSNTPLADLDFAYHFDASLFAAFLRGECEKRGVERIEGLVVNVTTDSETGFVRSVDLKDGRSVGGDLFVDCSGMRALLIDGARIRRLEPMASVQSRACGALRKRFAARALYALDREEGRLAMAHSASAPHRQRTCLLRRSCQR